MRLDTALTHERAKQKSKSENTNSFEEPDKKKRFVLIVSKEAKPGELGKDVPRGCPQKEIKLQRSWREKERRRETMGGRGRELEEKSGKERRGY